ncbi:hypothetical protein ACFLZN_00780, partial [Nanoarchaeota archaeon]
VCVMCFLNLFLEVCMWSSHKFLMSIIFLSPLLVEYIFEYVISIRKFVILLLASKNINAIAIRIKRHDIVRVTYIDSRIFVIRIIISIAVGVAYASCWNVNPKSIFSRC